MMSEAINNGALRVAARKLRRLRLTDVYGRKEHPADTVASAMERGLRDAGSVECLEYILKHGLKYYAEACRAERTKDSDDE